MTCEDLSCNIKLITSPDSADASAHTKYTKHKLQIFALTGHLLEVHGLDTRSATVKGHSEACSLDSTGLQVTITNSEHLLQD